MVKKRVLIFSYLIFLFLFSSTVKGQENYDYSYFLQKSLVKYININKFSFGFKGGIGFWKIVSLNEFAKHSYPVGFMLGIFSEFQISKNLLILNELFYQNSVTNITVPTSLELNDHQKLIARYINLPILLKYQTNLLWYTYFYLGPGFAYLINAEYKFYTNYGFTKERNVTSKIRRFHLTIETGVGEKIKLYRSFLFFELRIQISLTKIQPKNFDNLSVGDWRNLGLIFLIGYNL